MKPEEITTLTPKETEEIALAMTTLRARTEYSGHRAPHLRRLERRLWELTGREPTIPALAVT